MLIEFRSNYDGLRITFSNLLCHRESGGKTQRATNTKKSTAGEYFYVKLCSTTLTVTSVVNFNGAGFESSALSAFSKREFEELFSLIVMDVSPS